MARQRPSSRRQIPLEEKSPSDSTLPASASSFGAAAANASSAVRITRSTARIAADPAQTTSSRPPGSAVAAGSAPTPAPPPSRKRKAPARCEKSLDDPDPPVPTSPPRRVKKQRRAAAPQTSAAAPAAAAAPPHRAARNVPTMSQSGTSSSSRPMDESARTSAHSPSGRRKPARGGKVTQDRPSATQSPPPCRPKKRSAKSNSEFTMKEAEDEAGDIGRSEEHGDSPPRGNNDSNTRSAFDEEDLDHFHSSLFGSGAPMGLQNTLRALSGMMSGMSSRLQHILCDLRARDDPSLQLIALQDLSDLLLVSNEDNLASDFSPEPYVRELVSLMQPNDMGEENPEIMLLACRCLANLMEAMGGSVSTVVMGGAVPVLCQKLLDIQFIDLAEQALSTLAKISVSFPASIVRAGGLTACLTYLDFFPTSTQRTAVTTAANCCRNLPHDSFAVVRDVMPTLLNVLASNDPKVVEQGSLCVSRIVESFRNRADKLEELIEPVMLKAVLRLLQAGTTNLVGPHTHTQFLRVLAIISRASPRLSMELLKMDVVDTLYQILTGVSPPPADAETTVIKMDSVLVMQALIHRPREQVYEALNVICELLPGVPDSESEADGLMARLFDNGLTRGVVTFKTVESVQKRRALLRDCKSELKRFAMVLLPTLTDAYSSTVNLAVRQKVLIAQLKMLHNLETALIEDSLRSVPYASFLAAILSQEDHPSLVSLALRCTDLLYRRLEHVYQRQFHREGVIAEVAKLAAGPLSAHKKRRSSSPMHAREISSHAPTQAAQRADTSSGRDEPSPEAEVESETPDDASEASNSPEDFDQEDEDQDDDHDEDENGLSETDSSSSSADDRGLADTKEAWNDLVVKDARAFLKVYQASNGGSARATASQILADLKSLAADIDTCYLEGSSRDADGYAGFQKLASYFDGDALESITSSELLNSGIITTLSGVFGNFQETSMRAARAAFLQAFMGSAISRRAQSQSTATTPFSVLIQKLQALLSRTEHFEVITVSHNSLENTRSNARNMLGRQLRLKLVAEDDSEIPRSCRNLVVSIHAIATFKALDDFLRPRISASDRPRGSRGSRHHDAILSQLAKAAGLRDNAAGSSDNAESTGTAARARPSSSADTTPLPNQSGRSGLDSWAAAQTSTPSAALPGSGRAKSSAGGQRPGEEDESGAEPLECADEKQLSDGEAEEDDEIDEQDEELNATVDDMDEDLSDDNMQDPSAVNMEVASSGKVTARQEDGTRVATPSQSTPVSKAPSSGVNPAATSTSGSLANAGRPFSSYAAAMASTPQDWHIAFFVDGKPVSNATTVYRAVHHDREHLEGYNGRNVWSTIHTVTFKRVPGPPPPEPSTVVSALTESLRGDAPDMPSSLSKDATTASILRLLSVLHQINATLDDVIAEHKELAAITPEPLAQFINTKLTSKLNRQLEEPLIVASNCLPSWSEDLARLFPFLFPFETRHLFLQSTAFGYSRAMMRWQNSSSANDSHPDLDGDDRPFLGRLQRQKVRISRTRILDSAMKVMELYGSSPSVLEVEYFEEVGTGLGPTLEFYSTVSKELSKKKLKIWRDPDSNAVDEYAIGKRGLFPAPMSDRQAGTEQGKKQLHLFKILGKFVARSMLDSRIIDISFNPAFFRVADSFSTTAPSLGTVKAVDSGLANSLLLLKRFVDAKRLIDDDPRLSSAQKAQALLDLDIDGVKVEDLSLDFTLPGYPTIELIKDGSNVPVTIKNVDSYIDRVVDLTLGSGVKRQMEAFRTGFSQVFPYTALRAFTPNELVMLFGRAEEDWSIETLMDSIKADHGFNMDSRSVRNLLQTMSELNKQQRRDFLQFVTGSPKLPIGGFKSLTPHFTVVCRPSEPPYTADDYLPSVMTCVNYLKLPDYSSLEVLRERLSVAIREGQGAFHLS